MMVDERMYGPVVLFYMLYLLAPYPLTMTIYDNCWRKSNVVFFTYPILFRPIVKVYFVV